MTKRQDPAESRRPVAVRKKRIAAGQPTPRCGDVLRFVAIFQKRHGYMPTVREICQHFGWGGLNHAAELLEKLEEEGFVTHRPTLARSLRITPAGKRYLEGR